MTVSNSTLATMVTMDYFKALWNYKPAELEKLLCCEVENHHFTNGIEDDRLRGITQVLQTFNEHYYSKVMAVNVKQLHIQAENLISNYHLIVEQELFEGGVEKKVMCNDHTTLHIRKEDGRYRIYKIMMRVTKHYL